MKTISKRELNQQTAQVLAGIRADEAVLITERGQPRWRIEAIDSGHDAVARLRADGRIAPAKSTPLPWPAEENRYTPAQVDALLADSRGDR